MEPFEYVSVLSSIIIGLGITQILSGVASLVLVNDNVRFYTPHTVWVILIFGFLIQDWWVSYEYSRVIKSWRLMEFLFIIVYPIILFIITRMLFPKIRSGQTINLKNFYLSNYKQIFAVGLFLPIVSISQNLIILDLPLLSQLGPLLLGVLFAIGIFTRYSKIFHLIFSLSALAAGLVYLVVVDPML